MKCMTGIVMAIALCSAGSVFAQSGVGGEGKAFDKTAKPLKVFGGLFIPNSNSGGSSTRTGFTVGFGYKFWENNIVTFDGEVRATVFQIRFNGDDATLAQVGFMMNIIGRPS